MPFTCSIMSEGGFPDCLPLRHKWVMLMGPVGVVYVLAHVARKAHLYVLYHWTRRRVSGPDALARTGSNIGRVPLIALVLGCTRTY